MEIKHFLKNHAYQNIPLTFDEAYSLGLFALEGCNGNLLAQKQSIATLCALHTMATYRWKWEKRREVQHGHQLPKSAAEQIAGICAAIFENDIALSEFGYLRPNVPYAMDNCGMGGDLVTTANVSTIAAFIAAADDIPMCKHGSPANADQGRHGSSDFISLLGIDNYANKGDVERCVEKESFGYTEALDPRYKKIHLQTHEVAKLPHMNDIIGPITNPLDPQIMTRRIVGVNHLIPPRIVAEVYQILNERKITNLKHGIFIRGFMDKSHYEGVDEASICEGGSKVIELHDSVIEERYIYATDFGLSVVSQHEISPPIGMSKGDFSLNLLEGRLAGPALEMIFANAAFLFYLAERSQDLKKCCEMAREVYLSGKVSKKIIVLQELLSKKIGAMT